MNPSTYFLLDKGVNPDVADHDNQTPFLKLYSYRGGPSVEIAKELLSKGVNVNQMSKQGMFALKVALVRRENEEIEYLVKKGADINQIDHKGRNLLHTAINNSSAGSDATFETEQLLIDLGCDINV